MGVPCVLSSKNGGGKGEWGDILAGVFGFWVTGWQVGILFSNLNKTAYFSDCLKK